MLVRGRLRETHAAVGVHRRSIRTQCESNPNDHVPRRTLPGIGSISANLLSHSMAEGKQSNALDALISYYEERYYMH